MLVHLVPSCVCHLLYYCSIADQGPFEAGSDGGYSPADSTKTLGTRGMIGKWGMSRWTPPGKVGSSLALQSPSSMWKTFHSLENPLHIPLAFKVPPVFLSHVGFLICWLKIPWQKGMRKKTWKQKELLVAKTQVQRGVYCSQANAFGDLYKKKGVACAEWKGQPLLSRSSSGPWCTCLGVSSHTFPYISVHSHISVNSPPKLFFTAHAQGNTQIQG